MEAQRSIESLFCLKLNQLLQGQSNIKHTLEYWQQVCFNCIQEARRDSQVHFNSPYESRYLKEQSDMYMLELNTWHLLKNLCCIDKSVGGTGSYNVYKQGDMRTLSQQISLVITEDEEISRWAKVVMWLEESHQRNQQNFNQEEIYNTYQADDRIRTIEGEGLFTETLVALQQANMQGEEKYLDPDGSYRCNYKLHSTNQMDEKRVLYQVWDSLRQGNYRKACRVLEIAGQLWKANIIAGGGHFGPTPLGVFSEIQDSMLNREDYCMHLNDLVADEVFEDALKQRKLWRYSCQQVAKQIQHSLQYKYDINGLYQYEDDQLDNNIMEEQQLQAQQPQNFQPLEKRLAQMDLAIFSLMSFQVEGVLENCLNWEDTLWAELRCRLEYYVELKLFEKQNLTSNGDSTLSTITEHSSSILQQSILSKVQHITQDKDFQDLYIAQNKDQVLQDLNQHLKVYENIRCKNYSTYQSLNIGDYQRQGVNGMKDRSLHYDTVFQTLNICLQERGLARPKDLYHEVQVLLIKQEYGEVIPYLSEYFFKLQEELHGFLKPQKGQELFTQKQIETHSFYNFQQYKTLQVLRFSVHLGLALRVLKLSCCYVQDDFDSDVESLDNLLNVYIKILFERKHIEQIGFYLVQLGPGRRRILFSDLLLMITQSSLDSQNPYYIDKETQKQFLQQIMQIVQSSYEIQRLQSSGHQLKGLVFDDEEFPHLIFNFAFKSRYLREGGAKSRVECMQWLIYIISDLFCNNDQSFEVDPQNNDMDDQINLQETTRQTLLFNYLSFTLHCCVKLCRDFALGPQQVVGQAIHLIFKIIPQEIYSKAYPLERPNIQQSLENLKIDELLNELEWWKYYFSILERQSLWIKEHASYMEMANQEHGQIKPQVEDAKLQFFRGDDIFDKLLCLIDSNWIIDKPSEKNALNKTECSIVSSFSQINQNDLSIVEDDEYPSSISLNNTIRLLNEGIEDKTLSIQDQISLYFQNWNALENNQGQEMSYNIQEDMETDNLQVEGMGAQGVVNKSYGEHFHPSKKYQGISHEQASKRQEGGILQLYGAVKIDKEERFTHLCYLFSQIIKQNFQNITTSHQQASQQNSQATGSRQRDNDDQSSIFKQLVLTSFDVCGTDQLPLFESASSSQRFEYYTATSYDCEVFVFREIAKYILIPKLVQMAQEIRYSLAQLQAIAGQKIGSVDCGRLIKILTDKNNGVAALMSQQDLQKYMKLEQRAVREELKIIQDVDVYGQ